MKKRILLINEPNYKEITDLMTKKAVEFLDSYGYTVEVVTAPDIVELPTVLRYYIKAAELRILEEKIVGYIVLGCNDFDVMPSVNEKQVMQELENLKLKYSLAMGCGIFTPKDLPHGLEWAKSITAKAVDRCVQMLEIKQRLGL